MLDQRSVASPGEARRISSPRRRSFVGMRPLIQALVACVASRFRSRRSLPLKVLPLPHQVAVYQRSGRRPHLHPRDRVFWAWLSRLWTGWQEALVFVQPRTGIAWQRTWFREPWRRLSQGRTPGRPAISQEGQDLIRKMSQANPTWGAPRIVGELRNSALTGRSPRSRSTGSGPGNPHSPQGGRVVAVPEVGGLHHRYERQAA
jgi:hypothetical protein